jgi:two-component system phosphate regulon response regulator PhoB
VAASAPMKKILIVEDQDEIRELIRVTLEFDDYEIDEAPNGDIGLAKAGSFGPDLILLDVMMPGGLNGLQVCAKVKADPVMCKAKVILLTARGQESDRQAGFNAGADEYLIKPFSPLELMKVIDKVLS